MSSDRLDREEKVVVDHLCVHHAPDGWIFCCDIISSISSHNLRDNAIALLPVTGTSLKNTT